MSAQPLQIVAVHLRAPIEFKGKPCSALHGCEDGSVPIDAGTLHRFARQEVPIHNVCHWQGALNIPGQLADVAHVLEGQFRGEPSLHGEQGKRAWR